MAGTLTISTLSDGTNSTSATNCIQGSAKAWVNFNGSSGAIRASYNVSSITRNELGQYTVNYTNALPDANYVIAGSASDSGYGNFVGFTSGVYSTTQTKIYDFSSQSNLNDGTIVSIVVFR